MSQPAHPVLIVNPRSGGGKAQRVDLVHECSARGIEPVVFNPGDDLREVALDAVSRGADAIGVAGGDGSQALVAAVAAEHDLPYVCIPAGTRNHFAADLGVDRADMVGSLDAFACGIERRIDLARVNGRVFVNNTSLGVYAKVVQSDTYRNAKEETIALMLPDLLPPRARPFDLNFSTADGTQWHGAQVVLVSNNPYRPARPGASETRGGLDAGVLGVLAVRLLQAPALVALMATETTGAPPRFPGLLEFTAPVFVVEAGAPVDVAVDGEAGVLDPPLRFESLPSALRVRVVASAF
jgi:diacylglycerol kinase family enzyme